MWCLLAFLLGQGSNRLRFNGAPGQGPRLAGLKMLRRHRQHLFAQADHFTPIALVGGFMELHEQAGERLMPLLQDGDELLHGIDLPE